MTKINDADDGCRYFVAIPGRQVDAFFGPHAMPLYRITADGTVEVPVDYPVYQCWRRSVLAFSISDLERRGYGPVSSFAEGVARAAQLYGEQWGVWKLKEATSDSN